MLIRVVLRNVARTPFTFDDGVVPTCPIILGVRARSAAFGGSLTPCTGPGASMPRPPLTIEPGDSTVGEVWWPGSAALSSGALPAGTYDVVAAIWWSHFQITHDVAATQFTVAAP